MDARRTALRALVAEHTQGRDGATAFLAAVQEHKAAGATAVPEDLFLDLEWAFRDLLGDLLRSAGDQVESLLQLAIGYALAEAEAVTKAGGSAPLTGKLPVLLFEDLIEGSVLQTTTSGDGKWSARRAWAVLEQNRAPLTEVPALFQKGKLVLLRMCNGLVRRLSKFHDTEWCGRVLMFLAAAYPLSERSAVNVKGETNVLNVTEFESRDEADLPGDGTEAMAVDEPAEETKDATAAADEEETRKKRRESGSAAPAKARAVSVNYALYQSMWGLQRWMTAPGLALGAANEWRELLEHVEAVVRAFEFHKFAPHELEQGREAYEKKRKAELAPGVVADAAPSPAGAAAADEGEGGSDEQAFFGCKYLTTSRLLPLQLVDPQFRVHMVTQLMVLSSNLRAGVGTSAVPSDAPPSDPRRPANAHPVLDDLETRLAALLDQTPPNGPEYAALLAHVLAREAAWKTWKNVNRCAAYERFPAKAPAAPVQPAADAARPVKKRRRGSPPSASLAESLKQKPINLDTETIAGRMPTPQLKDHFERFLDAEDPDNGIEDTYHPKHDKMYCWQATRLIMNQQPAWLVDSAPDIHVAARKLKDAIDQEEEEKKAAAAAAAAVAAVSKKAGK